MSKSKVGYKRKSRDSIAANMTQGRDRAAHQSKGELACSCKPRWERELRKLGFGHTLVKQFRRRAPMAERILTAFEEEGWKGRIDDPLPPLAGRRESKRLRNQVQALNRRLQRPVIRFFMDGSGQGICWEPA